MKRSDIIPLIVVSLLLLVAFFELLPVVYLLLLTFLLLMCGALIYCYPLKGSIWTSATLLILFGMFSMYQVHYLAFTDLLQNNMHFEASTLILIVAIIWMVTASVELLHWGFSVLHRINNNRKPVIH